MTFWTRMVSTRQRLKAVYKRLAWDNMCCTWHTLWHKLKKQAVFSVFESIWTLTQLKLGMKTPPARAAIQAFPKLKYVWRQLSRGLYGWSTKSKLPIFHISVIPPNATHVLAVRSSCHYLWSRSTIRVAQILPTVVCIAFEVFSQNDV